MTTICCWPGCADPADPRWFVNGRPACDGHGGLTLPDSDECCDAIVDRPTAPERAPLDLAALEAATGSMSAAPWMWSSKRLCIDTAQVATDGTRHDLYEITAVDGDEAWPMDAGGIVALRNAAPSLLAEIRTIRDRASLAEGIAESRASHAAATVRARRESEERLRARIGALTAACRDAIDHIRNSDAGLADERLTAVLDGKE